MEVKLDDYPCTSYALFVCNVYNATKPTVNRKETILVNISQIDNINCIDLVHLGNYSVFQINHNKGKENWLSLVFINHIFVDHPSMIFYNDNRTRGTSVETTVGT